jgi:hypothetical protein
VGADNAPEKVDMVITLIIQMQEREASSSQCTQRQYIEQLTCTTLHHVTGNRKEGAD